ncbi:MAG: molecular chaperone HtpG [Oscillospiraceae bacterium]
MRKKQFKAESKRLLDLMINSIYTNREIFLRELISNASDAIDKLCYLSLTDDKVGMTRDDFKITITPDENARTLTISDNGIGMTAEELESNLGTIARSGSKQFKDSLEGSDADAFDIIGQFGVGFYSAFMVADTVRVISRAYGSETANVWESNGADGYTMAEGKRDFAGTDIILHIKPDAEDEKYSRFLDRYELASLVTKYSDYIRWPIIMDMEHTHEVETGDKEGKKETVTVLEPETLNSRVPIWQKPKNEVKDEDYFQFYREKFYDFDDPLRSIHLSAEGAVTYKALLFIPAKAPYDFYTKEFKKGLQLYSSGVLIMDKCAELLPDHFRFVRGVVDSADLSLNISREMLQHDRQLKTIASNLEKKIKSELSKMLVTEREKYEEFWKGFGTQIKYGAVAEFGKNKELLRDLLMFYSSTQEKNVTLAEYVSRMPENQKYIYYATGASLSKIGSLPQLERLKSAGFEVLFLTEGVDEFVLQILGKHEEKEFRNITTNEDMGLDTAETSVPEKNELTDKIKEYLGDKVKDVRVSRKLTTSAACLTADGPVSFEMEKYLNNIQGASPVHAERVLEINPEHSALAAIARGGEKAKDYAEILYYQALIAADLPLDDPNRFFELINGLMV